MSTVWLPKAPFEVFVCQIQDSVTFTTRGKEPISAARVVRLTYRIIANSGQFPGDCHCQYKALTSLNLKSEYTNATINKYS